MTTVTRTMHIAYATFAAADHNHEEGAVVLGVWRGHTEPTLLVPGSARIALPGNRDWVTCNADPPSVRTALLGWLTTHCNIQAEVETDLERYGHVIGISFTGDDAPTLTEKK